MVPFLRIPVAVSPRILNHFNLAGTGRFRFRLLLSCDTQTCEHFNVQHKLSFISIFISKIRLGKRPAFQTPFDYASNCKYFHVGIHALVGVGACRVARTILSNERKAGTNGRLGVPMFSDPCPKQPSMKTGFSLACSQSKFRNLKASNQYPLGS